MNCVDQLVAKYKIDVQDAADIVDQVLRQRELLENQVDWASKLLDQVKQSSQENIEAAIADKRAKQIGFAKRLELFRFVTESFKGHEAEAFPAILGGSQRDLPGARKSVDATNVALRGQYLGGLIADLNALDSAGALFKIFRSGEFDGHIARALTSLTDSSQPYNGPQEALQIAKVIHKWQEQARQDANNAGAWIKPLAGFIVQQTHDRDKIRAAGETAWRRDIEQLLNWNRIQDGRLQTAKERGDFLHTVYTNIVFNRRNVSFKNRQSVGSGRGSIAARLSAERVLHFSDADAWMKYNKQYGRGNLREAVADNLSSMAQSVALMRVLGPDPYATMDAVINIMHTIYAESGDTNGEAKLNAVFKHTKNLMMEVDGTLNMDAASHPTLTAVGRISRVMQNIVKLGGVVLSSFSDIPTSASEMAYQGRGFYTPMFKAIGLMLKGRGTKEQQRILSSMGVFADNMIGDVVARVAGDDTIGALSKAQALFFRLNLLGLWTDSGRKAIGLMMAHDLAFDKVKVWGELNQQLRNMLEMYNISADEWDIIRSGQTTAADGRDYLTPDALETVSDEMLAAYLNKKGVTQIDDVRLYNTRQELADRFRTMLRDRISYAILEPDAKTRAILHQGTSAGTLVGEIDRWVIQFKSFTAAYMQRIFGRTLKGSSGTSTGAIAWQFANLFLMTTLCGYLSGAAKDLTKGRTPRNPFENLESAGKTMVAAMLQGGGLGIMGDFLFGNFNRFGGSFAESAIGPALGTLGDITRIYSQMREGDNFSQSGLRFIQNNLPFANLFYVRSAMDYLIMYNLYEKIKPGYFRRMKRRVERENNQKIFLKPLRW